MPNVEQLANYAEIVGVVSVIGGIFWVVFQIRQFKTQRAEHAAVELVRSWHTPDFARALRTVAALPEKIEPDEMRKTSPDLEDMAFVVGNFFESAGVMVYRGIIPLYIVDDLMGGATRIAWGRLEVWIDEWRRESNPRAYEWWEWLKDRLDEHSELSLEFIAPKRNLKWK